MPWYVFKCSCGKSTDEIRTVETRDRAPRCDCGRKMKRDVIAALRGFKNTPGNWPMWSDALGCHPKQIGESVRYAAKHGIKVEFNERGQVKLDNPRHRKEYAQLNKVRDLNGGYSDP